ncbi:hypothetical protein CMI41_02725 [Candidatus Pacearchaeota archaeon]|nr:hypothetical protein [Candidatus Pacearchaeota archaeon]|tara:strand:- start:8131 stop:8382 length:252 start_codon:yes stop_codon:yes gene_type:complete
MKITRDGALSENLSGSVDANEFLAAHIAIRDIPPGAQGEKVEEAVKNYGKYFATSCRISFTGSERDCILANKYYDESRPAMRS